MIKKITCIECPQGCQLEIDAEGGRVIRVTGHKCPKGEDYAKNEIENPMRILSATVLTRGLELKLAPVRTSQPIPKIKLREAMEEIRRLRIDRPVGISQAVVKNFLGLGVDLITTRETL
jgi:CxxC motif-containing protein